MDDIAHMQQEAARRVQRMQQHARQVMESHRGRTPESLAAARIPPPPSPAHLRSPGLYTRPETPSTTPLPSPARALSPPSPAPAGLEAEQWLLLGLALLLFRSGCSTELLLALLYIAM